MKKSISQYLDSQTHWSGLENWSNAFPGSWSESNGSRYSRYIYIYYIYANDHEFFGYCNKFKYLGSIFTPSLKDDADIDRRITSAAGASAMMKRTFCNVKLPAKLRFQVYDATVANIILWECESWAMTEKLYKKLEICYITDSLIVFDLQHSIAIAFVDIV